MLKLLILDRDGVINYDSDAYIKSVEEWIPLPGSIEAIAQLSKAGWTVAIATNQSGIARGYYDIATLEAMHARLRALVAEQGGDQQYDGEVDQHEGDQGADDGVVDRTAVVLLGEDAGGVHQLAHLLLEQGEGHLYPEDLEPAGGGA